MQFRITDTRSKETFLKIMNKQIQVGHQCIVYVLIVFGQTVQINKTSR